MIISITKKYYVYSSLITFLLTTQVIFSQAGPQAESIPPCTFKKIVGECDGFLCLVRNYLEQVQKTGEIKERDVPNALLLYGEHGTGKTEIAKQIAHESQVNLKEYQPNIDIQEAVSEKISDQMGKEIWGLYEDALEFIEKNKRPVIILIDNVDLLGNHVFATLRAQIDLNRENSYIMTVLTAHDIGRVERGLKGRCIPIKQQLPNQNQRHAILKFFNEEREHKLSDNSLDFLSYLTTNFSGKDLKELVHNVSSEKYYDLWKSYRKIISENPRLSQLSQQRFITSTLLVSASVAGLFLYKKLKKPKKQNPQHENYSSSKTELKESK